MPLSDELRYALELARKNLNEIYAWDEVDVIDLLRIIDTLQAENAALREVLAALVGANENPPYVDGEWLECNYCSGKLRGDEKHGHAVDHDPGCPVTRARALLTTQPTPDAAPRAELSEWDDLAALDD